MGRTAPSRGVPPPSNRKDARAKSAKQTVNKDIPRILQAYPRARKGAESSELITNPGPISEIKHTNEISQKGEMAQVAPTKTSAISEPLKVSLRIADTLQVAMDMHQSTSHRNFKTRNVAILNMASPLRPGGGFLNGATSQEESLCMRTTLYPSLKEEFYRLPEVGGVWTSDVLVFRPPGQGATDLPKNERFFIDVITSGMLRFPDVEEDAEGEKRFASKKDRDMIEIKMRAVMQIAKTKSVGKIVLGAWGCGAFGNPVDEVAKAWRKVLLGDPRAVHGVPSMQWTGIEVVFAIKERAMAHAFASCFGEGLEVLEPASDSLEGNEGNEDIEKDEEESSQRERNDKIASLEAQITTAKSQVLKERLQAIVANLKSENG